MNRRAFICNSGILSLFMMKPLNIINSTRVGRFGTPVKILPQLLKSGDKVAITAPASGSSLWEIQTTVNFFKKMNCQVIVGETVINRDKRYRYLSWDDNNRAREFMEFVQNPEIRAIIAARGGYGSIRILNYLDYNLIANDPKIYVGFSDITALLIAIYDMTGIITYHGPVANQRVDFFSQEILKTLLFKNKFEEVEKLTYKFSTKNVLADGIARGELVGGNLSGLVSLLGTDFDFDTSNKILFFEDISEPPYKIDRMLKQLELAGKFDKLKGIIIGSMGSLDARRNFFPDYSFTILEVLKMNLNQLRIPIIINFPFGHTEKFFTFPIGFEAEINTYSQEFSLILFNKL